MIKKIIESFPVLGVNYEIIQVFADCIEIMHEELNSEYLSIVKPKCLKTLNQYVFLPPDHSKISKILEITIQDFSDLYIYGAIVDRETVEKHFQTYKHTLNQP